MSNASRIAQNTIVLYIRSFVVLLISLYTSRLVLQALGVVDFGIYNVVGGVLGLLSFLNTSMASTYQRFFNYEMGRNNKDKLTSLFQSSLFVQLLFAVLIIILFETVGLWFLNNKLVISPERMGAAQWVYQFSVVAFALTMFQAPFQALIIAHEKMSIFAYISVLDSLLKFVIAVVLAQVAYDRLIVYGGLMMGVVFVSLLLYVIICKRKFSECKLSLNWERDNLKALVGFGGWGMFGSLSYTLKSQGLNVVLNLFFGPVVNAARGVAYQILNAVEQFTTNFQTSFRPQLIKSYAEGDLSYMYKLYYAATKISCYLLWCLSLPIIMEAPLILQLWLGDNVPEYTVIFTRLILLTAVVSVYANPTTCIAYATGRIKGFTLWIGLIDWLIVPVAYVFLKMGFGPASTMVVSLVVTIFAQIARLFLVKRLVDFSIKRYAVKVVIPTFVVMGLSSIIVIAAKMLLNTSIFSSLCICVLSVICVILMAFCFGFNTEEKSVLRDKIKQILHRRK